MSRQNLFHFHSPVSFGLLMSLALTLISVLPTRVFAEELAKKPLKVFVLCGQSNMEGHAKLSSFDHIGLDPKTAPILKEMTFDDKKPRVCDQVWISYLTGSGDGDEGMGKLTAGYGSRKVPTEAGDKIGPEFTFGIYMEKLLDEPILIIKTAWGGKSLNTDFRSPSAGAYEFNQKQFDGFKKRGLTKQAAMQEKAKATGKYYRLMTGHVKHVLGDIKRVYPDYDAEQGYELSGFVWFQGWNDMVDGSTYPNRGKPGGYDLYSELMAHFIRDVRKDLSAPDMHFVIGVMGTGGPVEMYDASQQRYKGIHSSFRKAMAAPASMPEFKGNVTAVLTEKYWDHELEAVIKKNDLVNQKARALAKANQGFPDKKGTISPKDQKIIVDQFRVKTISQRDVEILKGRTNAAYHYLGSAKIMAQIGKAFAEALSPHVKN